jgi:hypothetical protein
MSLNFTSNESVRISDISTARFERLETWSFLAFFRTSAIGSEERTIVGKRGTGLDQQFHIYVVREAAPSRMRVFGGGSVRITGAESIATDTWYLVAVTNDGTGGTDGITLYTLTMDGSFIDDAVTGTFSADSSDLTENIYFGIKGVDNTDDLLGDIDYPIYVDKEMSRSEILHYLYNPVRVAAMLPSDGSSVEYFFKFGATGADAVDLSGKNISPTLNGTPTVANTPPALPAFFSNDYLLPYEVSITSIGWEMSKGGWW